MFELCIVIYDVFTALRVFFQEFFLLLENVSLFLLRNTRHQQKSADTSPTNATGPLDPGTKMTGAGILAKDE